jgi:apoptosis-inducing factor 2
MSSNSGMGVLVIGGGLAGCAAIKGIRSKNKTVPITLVEPKEYCEVLWAAYRTPFDEKTANGSLFPLAPFCKTNVVTHIQSTVSSLSPTKAVLANGQEITFSVCVVAVGATALWKGLGRGPTAVPDGSIATRKKLAAAEGAKVLSSKSVLIVGGGLIGTEVAGEIAARAGKGKIDITLVHSGAHLCPEMNEKAAAMVKSQLEGLGVKVLLNERATKGDGDVYTLKSGATIVAESVISTTGFYACNDFMKDLPDALNDKGFIQTNDSFVVPGGQGKIFAMGDCCTTLPNSGAQVLENVAIMGHNVTVTLAGGDATKLKSFKLGPLMFIATTGPKSGVFSTGNTASKRMLPWLKNSSKCLCAQYPIYIFSRVENTRHEKNLC